jgi:hypothetical protein
VHTSDSGLYYCKVNPEFLHRLAVRNSKNHTKSLLQYSMDKTFSNDNAKLVKLNVIQNKGAESSYSYDDEKGSNKENITIEPLPLCPQNIKINQTKNGILITWAYPKLTPVKIESFQIYFREINNEKLSSMSEWKTSESIESTQIDYFIDEEHLNENRLYEFQMVSFSIYSKSLPSNTIKLKYAAAASTTMPHHVKPLFVNTLHSPNNNNNNSPIYLRLVNISQLDIILIAIFVILVFILILCIVACVAYKRSFKNKSNNAKGINIYLSD